MNRKAPTARIAAVVGCLLLAMACTASRPGSAAAQTAVRTIAWNWLGCVGRDSPCAPFNGMNFPKWLTVSPDGRNLYVSAQNGDSVAILARDVATGRVHQPAGQGGCLSDNGAGYDPACTAASGLDSPQGIAVSPDGANVYVAASASNAITVLARDDTTGQLRFVQCLSHRDQPDPDCAPATALAGASFPVVSPDGRNVYVTAVDSQALTVYERDLATGRLTQTECFVDASTPLTGCTPSPGLKQAFTATMDPAGHNVYVAARASSAVATFRRDASRGSLTSTGCIGGDRGYRQDPACAAAVGMQYVQYVAPSPDGKYIYAAATDSHAIGVFLRGTDGGLTQQALPDGCLQDAGYEPTTPCRPAQGLALPLGMAFTPDGRAVFLAEFGYGAITAYERDVETGGLQQVGNCLGGDPRCAPQGTLQRAGSTAVVDDQLFVTAAQSNAVNVLRPVQTVVDAPTPTPAPTPIPPGTSTLPPTPVIPDDQDVIPSEDDDLFAFVGAPWQRLRAALRAGLTVPVSCGRPCRLSFTLAVSRAAAVRHGITKHRRPRNTRVTVGRLRTVVPSGGARVRVPFTRVARSKLSRAQRVPVWLTVAASHDATTVHPATQRVVLRRDRGLH
jgi:DNA-binding beta-propeller fold protein YncE